MITIAIWKKLKVFEHNGQRKFQMFTKKIQSHNYGCKYVQIQIRYILEILTALCTVRIPTV